MDTPHAIRLIQAVVEIPQSCCATDDEYHLVVNATRALDPKDRELLTIDSLWSSGLTKVVNMVRDPHQAYTHEHLRQLVRSGIYEDMDMILFTSRYHLGGVDHTLVMERQRVSQILHGIMERQVNRGVYQYLDRLRMICDQIPHTIPITDVRISRYGDVYHTLELYTRS